MAKRIHYFGDINACAKHRHGANMLLDYIDKQDLSYGVFRQNFSDGSRVKVNKVSPFLQTVDIYAGEPKTKKKYEWTLLYAPCPYPDRQDWAGWIECSKTTLVATNFLNAFSLIWWGDPIWDCMGTISQGSASGAYSEVADAGICEVGIVDMFGSPDWLYAKQKAFKLIGNQSSQSFTVTFYSPSGILFSESYTNRQLTDAQVGSVWVYGVIPTALAVLTDAGFINAQSYPPDYLVGFIFQPNTGNTMSWETGYVDWTSTYMLGFWKQEWTFYNQSSYLDKDNWVTFYDKYIIENAGTGSGIGSQNFAYTSDSYWDAPGYGLYYGGRTGGAYPYLAPYWAQVLAQAGEIVDNGHGAGFYNYWDPSIYQWFGSYDLYSPWDFGTSVAGSLRTYRETYTTTIKGMINGVGFEEIIGTANKVGGSTGTWSGVNVFPWMGRIYKKTDLLEGEESHSDSNLLIASWLTADAASLPGMGASWATPGCTNTGIHTTTYYMKHGDLTVTKAYGASHPGWHDVYTQDGITWRAYGDLFAALKEVREEEEI